MIEEKDWGKWQKKGKRLNWAWFATLLPGMVLVVMSPSSEEFQNLWWVELLRVVGIVLVVAGIFFNWKFRQHLRKAM